MFQTLWSEIIEKLDLYSKKETDISVNACTRGIEIIKNFEKNIWVAALCFKRSLFIKSSSKNF